jgi:membrane-bound metal-dependent hydrolase YbcI (DUF457 family)
LPFTPYHFGPSAFIGLSLKRWLDVPVFVLANVIVDIEVLFAGAWPHHQYWHWHSLSIGTLVGAIWGLAAYPLRNIFKKIMQILHIPYKTGLRKMVISGILGVWLHVAIDAFYHWDVQIFWPSKTSPLYELLTKGQVTAICIAFFVAAVLLYVITFVSYTKQNKTQKAS